MRNAHRSTFPTRAMLLIARHAVQMPIRIRRGSRSASGLCSVHQVAMLPMQHCVGHRAVCHVLRAGTRAVSMLMNARNAARVSFRRTNQAPSVKNTRPVPWAKKNSCPRRTQHSIGSASHVCLGGLATTPHDAAKTVPLENFSGDQVKHSVKHAERAMCVMLRRPLAAMLGSL